ncbi:hypothetical protein ABZ721_09235 [Streptomyces sp. NPDC006733]|uniref:hypothetical protein n=1 Tax=Streptomyces sp. NPDC006733 TaxID=3155460 RepID=UPI0033EDFDB6
MSEQSPMRGFLVPNKRRVRWTLSLGASPTDGGVVTDYIETARGAFRDAFSEHLSSVGDAAERRAVEDLHAHPVSEWLAGAFENEDASAYTAPGIAVAVH